jgi:hypothetical protein
MISCMNGPNGDMFMNYMDYVDDVAMFMFTSGQVIRIQATLDSTRSSVGTNFEVNWQDIGHANGVVGMTALNNKLFCATNNNRLWTRDPVLFEVNWQDIGHANGVVGMATLNGKLFCATSNNRLWARDP